VVVAWLGCLLGLALADSETAAPYVLGGVPLTVATGALVDRYWVLFVPSIVEILGLLAFLVGDLASHSCANCEDGGGWGFLIVVGAMTFTIPATALMAIGVGARRLTRFFRDLPSGDEPGGEHA
jgi:hypothetical protein